MNFRAPVCFFFSVRLRTALRVFFVYARFCQLQDTVGKLKKNSPSIFTPVRVGCAYSHIYRHTQYLYVYVHVRRVKTKGRAFGYLNVGHHCQFMILSHVFAIVVVYFVRSFSFLTFRSFYRFADCRVRACFFSSSVVLPERGF